MRVDIANGKYTYVLHDGGAELLRLGETWEDVTGQKVWYCAAYELQEARAERDELRKLAYVGEHMHEDCSWKARFAELKAERDALAAHVERLQAAGAEVDRAKGADRVVAGVKWLRACNESPETSLERLKAKWQAEVWTNAPGTSLAALKAKWQAGALDKVADLAEKTGINAHPGMLRRYAKHLRRQAGGDA